uniref:DEP domain-containing protein n=1 Tax=Mesocestoides corti TaxID=53468 RepID=A0A5K3FKU0_MESCO
MNELLHVNEESPCDHLGSAIIKHTQFSTSKLIHKLLSHDILEDLKPTESFRIRRQFSNDDPSHGDVWKACFFKQLPNTIQPGSDHQPLNRQLIRQSP